MQQLDKEYTVDGVTYPVHISMDPVDGTFFRTAYRFKYHPEDKDTIFYCFTSANTEVVFRYVIEAMNLFGEDWKKRLHFDYRTKQLFLDDQPLPV